MKSNLPLFIGLRYTRSRRRNQFISFVSGFSLVGMALGCLALIVVMSVMNGFDREIKERLLQVIPHVELIAEEGTVPDRGVLSQLQRQPGVSGVATFVSREVMVAFDRGLQGVQLRAVGGTASPESDLGLLQPLEQHMLLGSLDRLQTGEYNIVIGRLLARYLGVTLGDKISVTLPQLTVTPAGIFPRVKRFTVAGIFEIGGQPDQTLVVIDLGDAQKLFRMGDAVDGIQLETEDRFRSLSTGESARSSLPLVWRERLQLRDWSQSQVTLFSAIRMEKIVVSALLTVVVAVAAFNIITSLVLMVADKRGDIAVLRTLGMNRWEVMGVFVTQGFSVGVTGVLIGTVSGCLLAFNMASVVELLERFTGLQVFDPQVYFISHMPSHLMWQDVVLVAALGTVLSLLSTLYPAYRASAVAPAEVLRYQ